jgi:hypothetical protein
VKRLLTTLGVVACLAGLPAHSLAHDAYDDSQAHPLRIAAYLVHPVGFAAEWLIARPIHFLVSQPELEPIFGHGPHEDVFGYYPAYDPNSNAIPLGGD